jgi:hypothetical protein
MRGIVREGDAQVQSDVFYGCDARSLPFLSVPMSTFFPLTKLDIS